MQAAERGIVNLMQESYGGALVLFLTPIRADGVKLPTSFHIPQPTAEQVRPWKLRIGEPNIFDALHSALGLLRY